MRACGQSSPSPSHFLTNSVQSVYSLYLSRLYGVQMRSRNPKTIFCPGRDLKPHPLDWPYPSRTPNLTHSASANSIFNPPLPSPHFLNSIPIDVVFLNLSYWPPADSALTCPMILFWLRNCEYSDYGTITSFLGRCRNFKISIWTNPQEVLTAKVWFYAMFNDEFAKRLVKVLEIYHSIQLSLNSRLYPVVLLSYCLPDDQKHRNKKLLLCSHIIRQIAPSFIISNIMHVLDVLF